MKAGVIFCSVSPKNCTKFSQQCLHMNDKYFRVYCVEKTCFIEKSNRLLTLSRLCNIKFFFRRRFMLHTSQKTSTLRVIGKYVLPDEFVYGRGCVLAKAQDARLCILHSYCHPALLEHLHIIVVVSKSCNLLFLNPQMPG